MCVQFEVQCRLTVAPFATAPGYWPQTTYLFTYLLTYWAQTA